MAVAHELMGGPVVAQSLSKGSLFARSQVVAHHWDGTR
eukprot:CAMPEP_0182501218 /NCGR_PEP_ID=MMETSP1321-20130603/10953_1 /TAXON_ID=91990 /ORGANISM="Bolidomonas sp., Strain RCC1657" /LENGTH=37 /DNA_ID= /DNA_START= /DNA_END= /DNA_ORIENTATION=